jgi:hypothetical protein
MWVRGRFPRRREGRRVLGRTAVSHGSGRQLGGACRLGDAEPQHAELRGVSTTLRGRRTRLDTSGPRPGHLSPARATNTAGVPPGRTPSGRCWLRLSSAGRPNTEKAWGPKV